MDGEIQSKQEKQPVAGGRAPMAKISFPILALAALLLLLAVAFPFPAEGKPGGRSSAGGGNNLQPWECSGKCTERCSDIGYHKACITFCNKCCAKCLCVPPGHYGNKQACPCYNKWKTQEGRPKFP